MHAVVMTNAVTILIGLGLRYDVVEDGRPGFRAGAVTWYTNLLHPQTSSFYTAHIISLVLRCHIAVPRLWSDRIGMKP